jgi:hypothetical protein
MLIAKIVSCKLLGREEYWLRLSIRFWYFLRLTTEADKASVRIYEIQAGHLTNARPDSSCYIKPPGALNLTSEMFLNL